LTITSLISSWQIYKASRKLPSLHCLDLIAIGGLGIIFIFTQAPSGRFGMGYFIVINAIFLALFCEQKINFYLKFQGKIRLFIPLVGISFLLISSLARAKSSYFVLPAQLRFTQVTTAKINDVQYYYPVNYQSEVCWAAELPCALGPLEPNIKLRNSKKGIRGGFVRSLK
jgi:hypothetical protein